MLTKTERTNLTDVLRNRTALQLAAGRPSDIEVDLAMVSLEMLLSTVDAIHVIAESLQKLAAVHAPGFKPGDDVTQV